MTKFDLTFEDSTKRTVNRKPIHLMRAEQVGGKPGNNEQVLRSLWFADTKAVGFDAAGFWAWAESLDEWALNAVELEEDDRPGPTNGASPG